MIDYDLLANPGTREYLHALTDAAGYAIEPCEMSWAFVNFVDTTSIWVAAAASYAGYQFQQRMLAGLSGLAIVRRAEDGGWLLSRDLDTVSLGELHERLGLRVPAGDVQLPGFDDPIGREATRALEHLRQPLQAPLARSVGSFFTPDPDTPRP